MQIQFLLTRSSCVRGEADAVDPASHTSTRRSPSARFLRGFTAVSFMSLALSLAALVSTTACEPPASGGCTGIVDGDVYNLRIYNCLDSDMFVLVNGRTIGTVDRYDEDTELCGGTNLSSFPQCSEGEITIEGYELYGDSFEWDDSALRDSENGCWIVGIYNKLDGEILHPDAKLPQLEPTLPDDSSCRGIIVNEYEE